VNLADEKNPRKNSALLARWIPGHYAFAAKVLWAVNHRNHSLLIGRAGRMMGSDETK
jgi:hypothetical protein